MNGRGVGAHFLHAAHRNRIVTGDGGFAVHLEAEAVFFLQVDIDEHLPGAGILYHAAERCFEDEEEAVPVLHTQLQAPHFLIHVHIDLGLVPVAEGVDEFRHAQQGLFHIIVGRVDHPEHVIHGDHHVVALVADLLDQFLGPVNILVGFHPGHFAQQVDIAQGGIHIVVQVQGDIGS